MENTTLTEIVQRQLKSIPKIRSYTCIFLKNKNDYKQHGTGVFVKIESKYFLFTAAHVLDDIEDIFIPLNKGADLLRPGGEIITNHPTTRRENDELDLGILILYELSIQNISNHHSFLKSEYIKINYNQSNFLISQIYEYTSN